MTVIASPKFLREAKKVPHDIQNALKEKLIVFITDVHAPTLRVHKLSGILQEHWSFSINYQYRVLFRFHDNGDVVLISVGKHDDVY